MAQPHPGPVYGSQPGQYIQMPTNTAPPQMSYFPSNQQYFPPPPTLPALGASYPHPSPSSSIGSPQSPQVFTPSPVGSPMTPMTPPTPGKAQFTIRRKSVQPPVQPAVQPTVQPTVQPSVQPIVQPALPPRPPQSSSNGGSILIGPGQPRSAAFCKHCSSGIGFNVEHLWCSHCNLSICMGCREKHPSTHSARIKRMTYRATPFGVVPVKRACAGCKKVGLGLYCSEPGCAHATCYECTRDNSTSLWGAHPHAAVDQMQPPGAGFVISSLPRECTTCISGQTILGHCDRCNIGFTGSPYMAACGTCDQTLNRAVGFCTACAPAGQAEHDRSHKFLIVSVRLDLNNKTTGPKVSCLDCGKTGFSDIINHPHPRIDFSSGPVHMAEMISEARRDCPLAPVRSADAYAPNRRWGSPNQRCNGCRTIFAIDHIVSQCLTCCVCYCQTCTVAGPGKSHPHALAKLTLRRSPPSFTANIQRRCDSCHRGFKMSEAHLRCDACGNWDICAQCVGKHRQVASLSRGSQLRLTHGCCPNPATAAFSFYCPAPAVATAARGVGGGQRSRGVGGTGMSKMQMLNLALKGTKVALAVANAAMGGNNNGGGGGGGGFDSNDSAFSGGGDTGFDPGFTMDMQADTWAPVNAMASDPVL